MRGDLRDCQVDVLATFTKWKKEEIISNAILDTAIMQ